MKKKLTKNSNVIQSTLIGLIIGVIMGILMVCLAFFRLNKKIVIMNLYNFINYIPLNLAEKLASLLPNTPYNRFVFSIIFSIIFLVIYYVILGVFVGFLVGKYRE